MLLTKKEYLENTSSLYSTFVCSNDYTCFVRLTCGEWITELNYVAEDPTLAAILSGSCGSQVIASLILMAILLV